MGEKNSFHLDESIRHNTPAPKALASGRHRTGMFHVFAVLAISVLGLAAYSNSLHVPFVFDDDPNIVENQGLRWTSLSWCGLVRTVRESHSSSRPVANVSLAVNYYLGEYNVWGYHVVNVCIHLLNALLAYLLALATLQRVPPHDDRRLQPSDSHWTALAAALIFVSHPIQTQAVTYIVQRMTSLCVLFYLTALLLYICGRSQPSPRHRWTLWAGSFVCWLLALGSKQIAATLPLVILLYEWYFFHDLSVAWLRKNAKIGLVVFVLVGVVAWVYLGNAPLEKLTAGYASRDFTMGQRLLTQFRVVMIYLSLLLFPLPSRLNLNHFVESSQSILEPITTLISMVGIFGLLGLAVYLAPRHRLVSFCLLWFSIHLVIESSIMPLEMIFEHRLYLPMVGFALVTAWLIFAVVGRRPQWAVGLTAVICLLLAVGTFQRNSVWKDELTLWSDVVSKSPQDARAQCNLGSALFDLGRMDDAIVHHRLAAQINPGVAKIQLNLGFNLYALGRLDEAVARYQEALRLNPNFANAHNNLGMALQDQGHLEEAFTHYRDALEIEPTHHMAHNNLGRLLCDLGQFDDAVIRFRHALRIRPHFTEAHNNLGNALLTLGRFDEAVAHFQEALRWKPDDAIAHYNLGLVRAKQRRSALAVKHFQRAVQLKPDYVEAQEMLRRAQAYQNQNNGPPLP